jgi:hypothetical protein
MLSWSFFFSTRQFDLCVAVSDPSIKPVTKISKMCKWRRIDSQRADGECSTVINTLIDVRTRHRRFQAKILFIKFIHR